MKFFLFLLMISTSFAGDKYLDGCTIYSEGKSPTVYPGAMCIFLEDGSFISAGQTLKRIDKNLNVLWEVPGHYHHQINLSPDKKRILAITTEFKKIGKKTSRDDVLSVISVDGKVLHRLTMDDLYRLSKMEMFVGHGLDKVTRDAGGEFERSHFNSIHEIPANDSTLESFKAGNIIANSLHVGVFVFSPDLTQLLYHKKFDPHHTHDVQVRKTGELIYFNNSVVSRHENPYSAIEQFDPATDKVTFSFTGKPKSIFFSPGRGGVQELDDDTIFFSDMYIGGFYYSRSKGTITKAVPGKYGDVMIQDHTQQIRVLRK